MDKKQELRETIKKLEELTDLKRSLELDILTEECPFSDGDIILDCNQKYVFKGFHYERGWTPKCFKIKKNGELYENSTWVGIWGFNDNKKVGVYKSPSEAI